MLPELHSPVGAIYAVGCIVGKRETLQVGRLERWKVCTLERERVRCVGNIGWWMLDGLSLLLTYCSVLLLSADR